MSVCLFGLGKHFWSDFFERTAVWFPTLTCCLGLDRDRDSSFRPHSLGVQTRHLACPRVQSELEDVTTGRGDAKLHRSVIQSSRSQGK